MNDIIINNNTGNTNNTINKEEQEIKDDYYYIDRGLRPPRFYYYKHIKCIRYGDNNCNSYITQDELDFILKRELRKSPEQRYQEQKQNIIFHDLYYISQKKVEDDKAKFEGQFIDVIKEYGCGYDGKGCVPECRFYNKYGRIEDEEVIEKHKQHEKYYTIIFIDMEGDEETKKDYLEFLKKNPYAVKG